MIEHYEHKFNDMRIRPYELTRKVHRNYTLDRCEIMCVSGMPEGIGKSAHVNHSLADMAGFLACHDWEKLQWMKKPAKERPKDTPIWEADYDAAKKRILYPPEDVVTLCMDMIEHGIREPFFHWDDAGTWLNAMDFHDPFVIAFMHYLPLARSSWGAVVLSTPVEEWVLKKLHTAKGVIHVQVVPAAGVSTTNSVFFPRYARAYKFVRYAGNPKNYWQTVYEDYFTAIMPDSFFRWYKPVRDTYTKIAVRKMAESLESSRAKSGSTVEAKVILEDKKRQLEKVQMQDPEMVKLIEEVFSPPENCENHLARTDGKAKDFDELLASTFAEGEKEK